MSQGPAVTVSGPGAGQLLWEMKVSMLPQSRKFTKSKVKGYSIGRKVEFFHYTGLRNAACPVIIKHLTFYLFIWLAELAFLAFLVGLCCCFFVCETFFFPLKEARPPCRNISSLQETKQPMVNFPKPSLLCAPSASLQNLCKTESCLV